MIAEPTCVEGRGETALAARITSAVDQAGLVCGANDRVAFIRTTRSAWITAAKEVAFMVARTLVGIAEQAKV